MRIVFMMFVMLNLVSAQKLALVIGNSDYRQGFLPNPTKDADLIAKKLREVGFNITIKKNIKSVDKMKESINNFVRKVKEEDIAVVYYAGHGVQCKGTNYLIPTKAMIAKGGQLKSEALNLDFLIGGMSNIKLAVLMIDACRDNTYPSCSRSKKRGLVQPHTAKEGGMIISFATAEGKTADDGDKHSPYALALSKFINKKMPIETFFREVGGEVFASSSQRPMLKSSFYGRFSFGDNKRESKWITPKDSVCRANGGRIYKENHTCFSHGREAQAICSASKGRLPTKEELKKIVINCGGIINKDIWSEESKKNKKNNNYQFCYKEKGFSSDLGYWTSNSKNDNGYYLRYIIDLETGVEGIYGEDKSNSCVRCVKN